ncbi:MAG: group 1 truncated hemoglobin [Polyangiaceae bacterium]
MNIRWFTVGTFVLLPLVASVACGGKKPPVEPVAEVDAAPPPEPEPPPPPKTLFEKLGKKEGIAAVVEAFIKNVQADKVVNKLFAKITGPKLELFKQNLVEQLCEQTGGDCKFIGKALKDGLGKGTKVTEKQWEAIVSDMKLALDEQKVADTDKTEFFTVIQPWHDDLIPPKK